MTQAIITPSVSLVNGNPATTSLAIAEHFGKRHGDVINSIRKIALECPPEFTERNFSLSEYSDETGRSLPMFTVFFDGFILLAMGYTGKRALQIKLVYIAAFNAMREQLAGQAQPAPSRLSIRTDPERKALTAIINTWVSMAPIHYAAARTQVNAHFGVAKVDDLTIAQVKDALVWVQNKIDAIPQTVIPETKALPEASEPDADKYYARTREDLELVLNIMSQLVFDAQFRLRRGGRYSEMEIINRITSYAESCAGSLVNARESLREANRYVQMLAPFDKDKSTIVPVIGAMR